ncbi:MAG: transporter ATP-binding protein [Nocardioidaceae bacterium]|nr:transporter ATP-binding protein [Nocardioidaceae bacterium]
MLDPVIEIKGLRKEYGAGRQRFVAVDDLDLNVRAGDVHGFLGPSGAGKTTTIKTMLGLTRATAGEIRLFGERVPEALPALASRIGALVEEPKFSTSFSGRLSLELLARAAGVSASRVDEVIERVGLNGREESSFRTYSLGMKQRLAIAAALLRTPDLLVLDEPTNGLDPAGIRDVRTLIAELAASGVTVLLSSHLLDEVQQICRSVTIIREGRNVATGSVAEVIGENRSRTRVGVDDPDAAYPLLLEGGYTVERDGTDLLVEGHEHPQEISRVLAGHGIYVRELSAVRPDLEAVFLQLTHDAPAVGAAP